MWVTCNHIFCTALLLLLTLINAEAQFRLDGDAINEGNGQYRLVPNSKNKKGAIWFPKPHHVDSAFVIETEMYFGYTDWGADGIVFVMVDTCPVLGYTGASIGYGGMPGRSVGVEFDTYFNDASFMQDPKYDHVAVIKGGRMNHVDRIAGPFHIIRWVDDVEDGKWHTVKISYDPQIPNIQVHVDGHLRMDNPVDFREIASFKSDFVYWGFTSATGSAFAANSIRIKTFTERVIPDQKFCSRDSTEIDLPPLGEYNAALNKSITASVNDNSASLMLDSDTSTQWRVNGLDDVSFTIDLGQETELFYAITVWRADIPSFAEDYEVSISLDGLEWNLIEKIVKSKNVADTIHINDLAKYVKVDLKKRANNVQRYEIGEFILKSPYVYQWSPNQIWQVPNDPFKFVLPKVENTTYVVSKNDQCFGLISDTFNIEVTRFCKDDPIIFEMPNVFTPNGDGYNDVLTPVEIFGIMSVETEIYNRWGKPVYKSNEENINWTGQGASDGIYYWKVTYLDYLDNTKQLKGTLLLTR